MITIILMNVKNYINDLNIAIVIKKILLLKLKYFANDYSVLASFFENSMIYHVKQLSGVKSLI
jgi:hypothetical protein